MNTELQQRKSQNLWLQRASLLFVAVALAACTGVAEGGEDVVEAEVAAAEGLAFAEAAAVEVVVLPEVLAGVETARAAVAAGGRLLQDIFPIANGYAAFVEDSEGNRIGLHSR